MRAWQLPQHERRLALEALAALAYARLLLAVLPFAAVMRRLGFLRHVAAGGAVPAAPEAIDRQALMAIGRAIERAAKVAPFRAVCLQQALAASIMLRRRGLPVEVHLGVARTEGRITAHAWSASAGTILTGGGALAAYQPIAVFLP